MEAWSQASYFMKDGGHGISSMVLKLFTMINAISFLAIKMAILSKMSYHVDDGLVAHKGSKMWQRYKDAVSSRFHMKYVSLEEKKKFLGMRFHLDRNRGVCHIEQSALIMKMLMHFNMQTCDTSVLSPFLNPMPTQADIPKEKEDQENMQKSFDMYGAIGYLNYIQMGTRMDISCSLKILSQFAAKFGKPHVQLAKHIMRWLRKTINHQITLFGIENPQIQLFTDTSHASNPDTRKSITAVIGKLGGNTIFLEMSISKDSQSQFL